MQDVVDKATIDRTIDTMNPVDPMSYKPALTAAYNLLQQTTTKIKLIIVLGVAVAEDSYAALATQIHKDGITISPVAIGAPSASTHILVRRLLTCPRPRAHSNSR